jgi:hypothetical protein
MALSMLNCSQNAVSYLVSGLKLAQNYLQDQSGEQSFALLPVSEPMQLDRLTPHKQFADRMVLYGGYSTASCPIAIRLGESLRERSSNLYDMLYRMCKALFTIDQDRPEGPW